MFRGGGLSWQDVCCVVSTRLCVSVLVCNSTGATSVPRSPLLAVHAALRMLSTHVMELLKISGYKHFSFRFPRVVSSLHPQYKTFQEMHGNSARNGSQTGRNFYTLDLGACVFSAGRLQAHFLSQGREILQHRRLMLCEYNCVILNKTPTPSSSLLLSTFWGLSSTL